MTGRRYAETTTTSVDDTRYEIKRLVKKYGATRFIDAEEEGGRGAIRFEMRHRWLQFTVDMPPVETYRSYVSRGYKYSRSLAEAQKIWEQEYRRRWRVLFMLVKSKLVAITEMEAARGDEPEDTDTRPTSTWEHEFLPYMVVDAATGETWGDRFSPQTEKIYQGSEAPRPIAHLLPDRGGKNGD